MPDRIDVNTEPLVDDSLTTDLSNVPLPITSPLGPREAPPAEDPVFRIDPFGVNFDIYVPRGILNDFSPRTASEIPESLSGVNRVIPYWFGRYRHPAYPFKDSRDNGTSNPRYGLLYHVAARSWTEDAISEYEKLIIDGVEVDCSAWNAGTYYPISIGTNSFGMIFHGDGTQNVSTSAGLGYTTDALADYAIVVLRLDSRSISKAPRVEVIAKGQEITDYTLGTPATQYTDNFGNILVHWLEHVEGLTVNEDSAKALAAACEEDVGDGTKRRVGGYVGPESRQDARTIRQVLRAHAGASVIDLGTIFLVADRPADSVIDITPYQIVSKTKIDGPDIDNVPEDVEVLYMDIDTGTLQSERATDVIGVNPSQVRMTGITSAAQAKREAEERYRRLKFEGDIVTVTAKTDVMPVLPGDVARITDPDVVLGAKPYRILEMSSPTPGEWVVKGREYQDIYSDNVDSTAIIGNTPADNPAAPPAVTGLTLTAQNNVAVSGVDVQIKVEWTAPTFAFVALFNIEIYNNDLTGTPLVGTASVASDKTEHVFSGLLGGTEYEVKIRIMSTVDQFGAFANGFETTYPDTIARWPLEGTVSTDYLEDVIGEATLQDGTTTWAITGKVGSHAAEMDFDTDTPFAGFEVAGNPSTGTWPIELDSPTYTLRCWYRQTTTPGTGDFSYIFTRQGTNGFFVLRVDDTRELELFYYTDATTSATWSTGKTLTLNSWTFIALSFDGSQLALTVNTDDPVVLSPAGMRNAKQNELSLEFGLGGDGGVGEIDQIEVYAKPLSTPALRKLYDDEV